MATITIRIDDDLFKKIEQRRGNVSKSEYYREILEYYLESDHNMNTSDEVTYLRAKLDEALVLLAREQTLNITSQQCLLPYLDTEKKKWWKFW